MGEGNGSPLQCSCLENPRDRGAAVYGVAQSQTQLKQHSSSSRYAEWANRANFALLVLGCVSLIWNLWMHGAVILRQGQSMTHCYQYSQDRPKVHVFITDAIGVPPRCLTPAVSPSFPGCFHVLLQLSSSPEIFPKSSVALHPIYNLWAVFFKSYFNTHKRTSIREEALNRRKGQCVQQISTSPSILASVPDPVNSVAMWAEEDTCASAIVWSLPPLGWCSHLPCWVKIWPEEVGLMLSPLI